MEELKLRGYVTPEDFTGSDNEKLQKAMNTAVELDIRKVLIEKEYQVTGTVYIPEEIEVIFKSGSTVSGNGVVLANQVANEPEKCSWSFENGRIYLKGEKGAKISGNVRLFHAGESVLDTLSIDGKVTFEFCREIRMEDCVVSSEEDAAVTLMRGCNNFIMQRNELQAKKIGILIDTSLAEGDYVIGKDTENHELIIRDNICRAEKAVAIYAREAEKVFNVQLDHTACDNEAGEIGRAEEKIGAENYFNLTVVDFIGEKKALQVNNETKHCYFGE